jgi:hypothetical protein|tara:strand:+ start:1876 stop:3102 length:1227 start_codon:yes stop_codon:yes gene_type:complete
MNKIITSLFLLVSLHGFSQTADEVMSQGGVNDVYYDFETQSKVALDRTTWDIGLTMDMRGASIIINENGGTELYLYSADTSDWSTLDTAGFDFKNIYNSESTWNAGAFANQGTTHPDYGWGIYDMNKHDINGNRVFILKTKTGNYLKVVIDQMSPMGLYKFRTASLDGSNLKMYEYGKATPVSMGKNFALLDLDGGDFITDNPMAKEWDVLFTKYITFVQAGPNSRYQAVGGVKINAGCQVAEREGMSADSDDTSSLAWDGNVTQIGWDWKTFDLATRSYLMDTDLAYFVRTQNGAVYKLWFTDYTVGTAIYSFNTKEIKAGTLSANKITKLNTSVYPNPTADVLNINNKENETLTISLLNVHGVVVLNSTVSANATQSISTTDLAKGVYFLQLSTANTSNTQRVIFE